MPNTPKNPHDKLTWLFLIALLLPSMGLLYILWLIFQPLTHVLH